MLSDGNVQIARYDSAVHFLDENGEWKDIDNAKISTGVHFNRCTPSFLR